MLEMLCDHSLKHVVFIILVAKFSASLVNGQNDSSKHIICLNDFCIRVTRGIVSALVEDENALLMSEENGQTG